MLMVANGNMRILKKLDGGEGTDGRPWAHFAAISCEETEEDVKKNDFYILKTFGSMAEYIDRNLNMPRRVFVSGRIRLEKYNKEVLTSRKVKIGEKNYDIDFTSSVETQRTSIYVDVCDFLDKKREKTEDSTPKEEVIVIKESK
jgi:single-stranded DNA-binding protein